MMYTVPGRWVEMWRSGKFLLHNCGAAFWTREMSLRLPNVNHSVTLWSTVVIGSMFTYLCFFQWMCHSCKCPPYVASMSLHMTRFTSHSLMLEQKAGERRLGYEAAQIKLIAGYLTLRIRNGSLKSFDGSPHPPIIDCPMSTIQLPCGPRLR